MDSNNNYGNTQGNNAGNQTPEKKQAYKPEIFAFSELKDACDEIALEKTEEHVIRIRAGFSLSKTVNRYMNEKPQIKFAVCNKTYQGKIYPEQTQRVNLEGNLPLDLTEKDWKAMKDSYFRHVNSLTKKSEGFKKHYKDIKPVVHFEQRRDEVRKVLYGE